MDNSPIETFLRSANSLQRFFGITRAACWIFAILIIAGLVAIACDAMFALPVWGRLTVDGILLVGGFVAAFFLWRTARSFRFIHRKSARQVELMLDIDDNAIINAVDLAETGSERISRSMRQRAIEHGETLSQRVSFLETVQLGPLVAACLAFSMVGLATIIMSYANPSLFKRVVPRYLDVFGNHPAYTSLIFDIQTAPERVYQGQSALVDVSIDGVWLPENANLVQLGHDQTVSTPMMDTEPGSFQLELKDLQATCEFYVETDGGASDPFTIEVVAMPLFEKVWFHYDYPDYTGWKSNRKILDGRGVSALEGTQISIEIESNIDLSGGELKLLNNSLNQSASAPMNKEQIWLAAKADAPNAVTGQFVLTNQSRFELSLKANNGSSSLVPLSGRVAVQPDRPPRIHFSKPDPHIIAVEDWQIPVQLHFSDDVGLSDLILFRSVNGLGPYPTPLARNPEDQTSGTAQYEFDLRDLGARAGDIITYYATISDNYPKNWPGSEDHLGSTDTFVIQVISLEQYKEFARQHYRMDEVLEEIEQMKRELEHLQKQRNETLDQLEKLQEKLESGEKLTNAEQQLLEQLTKQLEEFSKTTDELAKELRTRAEQSAIYDFEETYREILNEMAAQLQQQSDNSGELANQLRLGKPTSESKQRSLRNAIKMFREHDQPFDSGSQQKRDDFQNDIKHLEGAEQMLQAIAEMKNIIEQQRLIADRMKEFSNLPTLTDSQQQRLKQLSKRQDLLEQDLEQAMEDMKRAAENARENFPKGSQSLLDIVVKINESGVLSDQQQATDSGQAGDGQHAHKSAEAAALKLEALQCDCNGKSLGKELAQGDKPLSIPKDSMCDSLQQLAQSMQLPSMKTGKQGPSGAGYRGSMAKATLYGPHQPSHSQSQAQSGGRNRPGKGHGTGNGRANETVAAEVLTPAARSDQTAGPASMLGVPSQYVEHARGYLKRITETPSATTDHKNSAH